MMNQWFKAGAGGSYSNYIKPRKKQTFNAKQKAAQRKLAERAISCKGKPQAEFRICMSK